MWSDNESDIDLLQFRYLANSVTSIIKSADLLPTTIGLFGDWGSGKSSLLKMVESQLSGDAGILTLSFNGWLFEGFDDAKTVLMGSILDEIQDRIESDKGNIEKAKNLIGKLLKRVNWFQLLGRAGHYAVPALLGLPHLTAATLGADAASALQRAKDLSVDDLKACLYPNCGKIYGSAI